MRSFALLDLVPPLPLAIFAVLLALAPVLPSPHLFDKLAILANGTLTGPADIFDLIMHSAPLVLLVLKLLRMQSSKHGTNNQ